MVYNLLLKYNNPVSNVIHTLLKYNSPAAYVLRHHTYGCRGLDTHFQISEGLSSVYFLLGWLSVKSLPY